MNRIYKLDYKHPTHAGCDEELSIGFFSSLDKIEEIIKDRMSKSGFKDNPRSCFIITEVFVDEYGWKNGFTSSIENDIGL